MKRRIDWLNHTLEFFVVLIGILIAFQLNKCSDNRTKRDLIKNHLAQIGFECQENTESLGMSVTQLGNQIKTCDALLAEISARESPLEIRDLATQLLDLRNAEVSTNAYTVLVQSGDIRFLEDYKVKRNIISLYEDFEKVIRIDESNKNLYDNHFYPYIKTNFDLINWGKVAMGAEYDESPYYAKEFANTVSTYRYLLEAKKRIYENQQKRIDSYLKQ